MMVCGIARYNLHLEELGCEINYTAFIRPILEYGAAISDNCAQYKKIESKKYTTRSSLIYTTGTNKLISINTLYKATRWDTLENHKEEG